MPIHIPCGGDNVVLGKRGWICRDCSNEPSLTEAGRDP
jgi:hypothetical protein